MSNPTPTPETVELWIRSFAPSSAGPTQERALERLDDLASTASIESIEVRVWGKEVEVDGVDHSVRIPQLRRIERRLEAFETWADRTDRRLEPFFRNAHVESSITGESRDVWRLPTIAVAEFDEDGDLLHVAPCRDGEGTIDVFDRFDALTDDDARTNLSMNGPGRADDVMTDRSSERTNYDRDHVDLPAFRSD